MDTTPIEIAIVGGGVSGLALARALHRAGHDVHVFEARQRLGGRVESVACTTAATHVDLGPAWYWPHTQPHMTALVRELSLPHFAQHDPGEVLVQEQPGTAGRSFPTKSLHANARRIAGGMASLVRALAGEMPTGCVHFGHVLGAVRREHESVQLRFECAGETRVVAARRVVLALPPRLIAERVRFEPALPDALDEALVETPTWMATQAKAVVECSRAVWREQGLSGNAFVQHEQATLKEVFDACEFDTELSALSGLLALSPRDRQTFRRGLPMLLGSQVSQLFGPAIDVVQTHSRDWAAEPFTCSDRDLRDDHGQPLHPTARPVLQRPHWDGRLLFAGTETAERETGYLEGALYAAVRVAHTLTGQTRAIQSPCPEDSLAGLREWLKARKPGAMSDYQRRIVAALADQDSDRATQRALVATTEALFEAALAQLQQLRGTASLGLREHEAFRDFISALITDVLTFNQRSCALSNFELEHRPSREYLQDMLRDVNAAYRQFTYVADELLGSATH